MARASGFRFRERRLEDGWWRADVGPLVASTRDERPVALVGAGGATSSSTLSMARTQGGRRPAAAARSHGLHALRGLGARGSGGRRLVRLGLRPVRWISSPSDGLSIVLGLLSLLTPIAAKAIFTGPFPRATGVQVLGMVARAARGRAGDGRPVYLVQGLALLRMEAGRRPATRPR